MPKNADGLNLTLYGRIFDMYKNLQYYYNDFKNCKNIGELGWLGSGLGLLESPCECGIEAPGSISHGVS